MILYIASVLVLAILLLRFVLPLRVLGITGRIIAAVIATLACFKYQIYTYSSGMFLLPELPAPVMLSLEFLFALAITLAVMMVLRDLLLLALRILKIFKINIRAGIGPQADRGIIFVLCAVLSLYGVYEAVSLPQARETEIRVAGLPSDLDGYRIVQLSDLHAGPLQKSDWVAEIVKRANDQNPDLIAITGDFIDGGVSMSGDSVAPLGDLKAKDGVYGITGNHEYYYDEPQWTADLRSLGINLLFNESRVIRRGGAEIEIGGIPDDTSSRFGLMPPDLKSVFPKDEAKKPFKILLSHKPAYFIADGNDADLQLSGHTHGGMMPLLRQIVAGANSGFVRGLYERGNRYLYVSPGTGIWNGFSCRILTPPEISVLILRSK